MSRNWGQRFGFSVLMGNPLRMRALSTVCELHPLFLYPASVAAIVGDLLNLFRSWSSVSLYFGWLKLLLDTPFLTTNCFSGGMSQVATCSYWPPELHVVFSIQWSYPRLTYVDQLHPCTSQRMPTVHKHVHVIFPAVIWLVASLISTKIQKLAGLFVYVCIYSWDHTTWVPRWPCLGDYSLYCSVPTPPCSCIPRLYRLW